MTLNTDLAPTPVGALRLPWMRRNALAHGCHMTASCYNCLVYVLRYDRVLTEIWQDTAARDNNRITNYASYVVVLHRVSSLRQLRVIFSWMLPSEWSTVSAKHLTAPLPLATGCLACTCRVTSPRIVYGRRGSSPSWQGLRSKQFNFYSLRLYSEY